jgi:peptidoglycan hydrolase CwlO-like protein
MRVQIAMQGLSTSYGPTDLNKSNLDIAERLFENLATDVKEFKSELESLENKVKELNPPHLSGTGIN